MQILHVSAIDTDARGVELSNTDRIGEGLIRNLANRFERIAGTIGRHQCQSKDFHGEFLEVVVLDEIVENSTSDISFERLTHDRVGDEVIDLQMLETLILGVFLKRANAQEIRGGFFRFHLIVGRVGTDICQLLNAFDQIGRNGIDDHADIVCIDLDERCQYQRQPLDIIGIDEGHLDEGSDILVVVDHVETFDDLEYVFQKRVAGKRNAKVLGFVLQEFHEVSVELITDLFFGLDGRVDRGFFPIIICLTDVARRHCQGLHFFLYGFVVTFFQIQDDVTHETITLLRIHGLHELIEESSEQLNSPGLILSIESVEYIDCIFLIGESNRLDLNRFRVKQKMSKRSANRTNMLLANRAAKKPTNGARRRLDREKTSRAWYDLKTAHNRSADIFANLGNLMAQYNNPHVILGMGPAGNELFKHHIAQIKNLQLQFKEQLERLWDLHKDKKGLCHSYDDVVTAFGIYEQYQDFKVKIYENFKPHFDVLTDTYNASIDALLAKDKELSISQVSSMPKPEGVDVVDAAETQEPAAEQPAQ